MGYVAARERWRRPYIHSPAAERLGRSAEEHREYCLHAENRDCVREMPCCLFQVRFTDRIQRRICKLVQLGDSIEDSHSDREDSRRDENHIDDLSDAHEMGNDPCREHGCNRSQGRWIEQFCDLLARFRTEQRERPAKGFAYLLRRIHCSDIRRWGNLQRRR